MNQDDDEEDEDEFLSLTGDDVGPNRLIGWWSSESEVIFMC